MIIGPRSDEYNTVVSCYCGCRFDTFAAMERGDELLSIPVAAAEIGMTRAALWRYVAAERLPAQKVGRDWLIRREDLEMFHRGRRPPGRPRKTPPE